MDNAVERVRGSEAAKRCVDVAVAAVLLALLVPIVIVVAIAIKLESRGPVFYRCRRVGLRGTRLNMLKFRKMHEDARGAALTSPDDARFTRMGALLARTKLDEVPQLWNVLTGEMSLVGPRPEDPGFVELRASEYAEILEIRPGITGLSQLAFARESEVLDDANRYEDYVDRLLPQKIALDRLYVRRRSLVLDLKILVWTAMAIGLRRDVAVHRGTGKLNRRRRPASTTQAAGSMA